MGQRFFLTAAPWLEIVVGALLLTEPDVLCLLLFGSKPEAVGMPLGRFAGIGLIALGIACLPSTVAGSRGIVVLGLFAFNAGVAILFAWVGVATTLHGSMLWPAVILHTIIALALLPHLVTRISVQ